jgi:alkylhydroperoxidase/carboxymuconolactone decarboxylase family protein YurZ
MNFEHFKSAGALEAAGESLHLTDREKHLIGLAVTTTRGCIKCTGSRIKKARDSGIPEATILAAIDLAAAVNAGVTIAIAIQGADLFGGQDECESGACVVGLATR